MLLIQIKNYLNLFGCAAKTNMISIENSVECNFHYYHQSILLDKANHHRINFIGIFTPIEHHINV